MIMNYRIEYHDENGSTIHEDQCDTFISNGMKRREWINSKNLNILIEISLLDLFGVLTIFERTDFVNL